MEHISPSWTHHSVQNGIVRDHLTHHLLELDGTVTVLQERTHHLFELDGIVHLLSLLFCDTNFAKAEDLLVLLFFLGLLGSLSSLEEDIVKVMIRPRSAKRWIKEVFF